MIRHSATAFTAVAVLLAGQAALAGDPAPAAKNDPAAAGKHEMTPEQKAEMEAWAKAGTPGAPHNALAAQVGTYDVVVKHWHDASAPAMEEKGTAKRTMTNGNRILVEDYNGTMMGQPFTGQGMRGHDNVTGKSWSTWTDSMSTGIMTSEGTCDDKGACTFTGSYTDVVTKKPAKTRMTTKWTSPTVEVFEMYGPGKDGKEMKMMEITYTKQGAAVSKK